MQQFAGHLQGDDVEDGGDGALAAGLAGGSQQLKLLIVPELHADVDRVLVKGVARVEAGLAAAEERDLPRAAHRAQVGAKMLVHHAHHALELRQPPRLGQNVQSVRERPVLVMHNT